MGLVVELKQHMNNYKIGSGVPNKSSSATHMEHSEYVTYYGLEKDAENKLKTILARCTDSNVTTYFHECFSEKYALVFDIDKNNDGETCKDIKEILSAIYEGIRTVFDITNPDLINCVVFTASTPQKMSYHVHFPDICVNKGIAKQVYDSIFKQN